MAEGRKSFEGIVSKLGLEPKESPLMVQSKKARLFLGIPKERSFQEHRIGLTPDSVRTLVANGHRILIESGAGADSHFYDTDYSEGGAEITESVHQVFTADIVIKIAPPQIEEIEMMQMDQTLISPLHLPVLKKEYVQ